MTLTNSFLQNIVKHKNTKNRVLVGIVIFGFFLVFLFLGSFMHPFYYVNNLDLLNNRSWFFNQVSLNLSSIPFFILLVMVYLIIVASFNELNFVFMKNPIKKQQKVLRTISNSIISLVVFFACYPLIRYFYATPSITSGKALYQNGEYLGIAVILVFCLCFLKQSSSLKLSKNILFALLQSAVFFTFVSVMYLLVLYGWVTVAFYWIFIIVLDVSAWMFGLWLGKHKPFKKISPKKSIEGYIGAIVAALFLMTGFYFLFTLGFKTEIFLPWFTNFNDEKSKVYILFVFLVFLPFVSFFGDLFFSAIKRQYKKKDFSNILGKHGGILDRFDAFLLVFYIIGLLGIIFSAVTTYG